MLGVGMMELPLRDNLRSAHITVAVHPRHRRRGVGTAMIAGLTEHGRAEGRVVLNTLVDVPLDRAADHPSLSFPPKLGSKPCRRATLAISTCRSLARAWTGCAAEVARDREADAYLEDQCALFQCMSTDEPHGDQGHEGEIWDAERAGENDALHTARRRPLPDRRGAAWCLRPAGGVHRAVDRRGVPGQACQMLTVVHLEHRGHRLGLAVKLANLDAPARRAPDLRLIVTENAVVHAPMIAVNDMMGFEVAGKGYFWQKQL
jgi:Acetyltransferase (GNAT) family